MLCDVDEQLLLQKLLQDVLGGHVNQRLEKRPPSGTAKSQDHPTVGSLEAGGGGKPERVCFHTPINRQALQFTKTHHQAAGLLRRESPPTQQGPRPGVTVTTR